MDKIEKYKIILVGLILFLILVGGFLLASYYDSKDEEQDWWTETLCISEGGDIDIFGVRSKCELNDTYYVAEFSIDPNSRRASKFIKEWHLVEEEPYKERW